MAQDTRRRDENVWPEPGDIGPYVAYRRRFETPNGSLRPIETVTIGGRTYSQLDDGQQNKLVPVRPSPPELEEAQRTAARIQAMLNSPLGAGAYGLAALAGASPKSRDMALAAGGAVDGLMMGAAPRGAAPARPTPEARREPPRLTTRPEIRLRDTNDIDQAQGMSATLGSHMLGTGTKVPRRIRPPGWVGNYEGNGLDHVQARSHLLANNLGGRGEDVRNVVTLAQNPANSPGMQSFERDVKNRVRQGEFVEYSVIPLYNSGVLPPEMVLLTATAPRQPPTGRIVFNPAGRRP